MNCLRLKTCRLDLFCVLNALGPEGEPYSMILQGHTGGEFESGSSKTELHFALVDWQDVAQLDVPRYESWS